MHYYSKSQSRGLKLGLSGFLRLLQYKLKFQIQHPVDITQYSPAVRPGEDVLEAPISHQTFAFCAGSDLIILCHPQRLVVNYDYVLRDERQHLRRERRCLEIISNSRGRFCR